MQRISPASSKYQGDIPTGQILVSKLMQPSLRNSSSHEAEKSYIPQHHHADSLNESGLKNYLQDMRVAQARALYGNSTSQKTRVSTARTSMRGTVNVSPNLVRVY